jgi:uncharacterized lipoprotein YehR (DUF1307 family)
MTELRRLLLVLLCLALPVFIAGCDDDDDDGDSASVSGLVGTWNDVSARDFTLKLNSDGTFSTIFRLGELSESSSDT